MFKLTALHSARRALIRSNIPARHVLPVLTRAYATGGSKENVRLTPCLLYPGPLRTFSPRNFVMTLF